MSQGSANVLRVRTFLQTLIPDPGHTGGGSEFSPYYATV